MTGEPNVGRPPVRPETDDPDLDRLLHPGRFYERPDDVLEDAALSPREKRSILCSWASDACAVDSCPPLRRPSFALRAVTFDEVMDALLQLDGDVRREPGAPRASPSGGYSQPSN